jgi:hypothetical protein
MLVTTNVHTGVGVRVWARSITYVANEMARVLLEVVQRRGLPLDHLHQHLETIVSGFRSWITGRYLHGAALEICDAAGRLVERYDLALSYQPPANGGGGAGERFETALVRLHALLATRRRLADDCRYRVVVDLEPGAPGLPGWGATALADTSHLQRQDLGGVIDTSRIGVQLEFWG